jgi:CheY-like chemotaxis protein
MVKEVLIVDDCEDVADVCSFLFQRRGLDVRWACDGAEGLRAVAARRPDLIVLDMMMPIVDGVAFLDRLPTVTSTPPPVLAYSGFDKFEQLALSRGASAFMRKPFDDQALLAVAQALLDRAATLPLPKRAVSDEERARAAERREAFWRAAPPLSAPLRTDLQRVVSGAARYFGAASAFVTALHGGALHVIAVHGADRFPTGCAMDPRVNFCPDVIAAQTPLLIEDGASSAAFRDHPAAAGDVRFYAGAPLLTADRVALGTLCLEDPRPRSFEAEDLAVVRHLAAAVGEAIDAERHGGAWVPLYADDGVVHPRVLEVLLDAELRRAERDGDTVEVAVVARTADATLAADVRAAGALERFAVAPHPAGAALLVGVHVGVDSRSRMDAIVRCARAPIAARAAYHPRRGAPATGARSLVAQAWRAAPRP